MAAYSFFPRIGCKPRGPRRKTRGEQISDAARTCAKPQGLTWSDRLGIFDRGKGNSSKSQGENLPHTQQ